MCENEILFFTNLFDYCFLYWLGSLSANKYKNAILTTVKPVVFYCFYRSDRMFYPNIFKEQISLELQ